jgi:riboflavin kinase/FMN adenylyltransferase
MNLFEGLESVPNPFPSATVAIGTFDGVHIGHQAIIRAAVEDARAHTRPALVFTFDRHPKEIVAPDQVPPYLTTPEQRRRLIADLGADALIVARFDKALSQLFPDEFVETILQAKLGAKAVVVGQNFGFGRERAGNVAYLEQAQARFDFTLRAIEPVLMDGTPVSSTRIRDCLQSGDIRSAERLLGHPYLLAGTVVAGQRLGRQLGYPTANLALTYRQAVPADGIYAVYLHLSDGRIQPGACSIGSRPTVEGAGRAIETYLLDFDEDLYGQGVEIRFVERLREERKFESLEALVAQMARDVAQARRILT